MRNSCDQMDDVKAAFRVFDCDNNGSIRWGRRHTLSFYFCCFYRSCYFYCFSSSCYSCCFSSYYSCLLPSKEELREAMVNLGQRCTEESVSAIVS